MPDYQDLAWIAAVAFLVAMLVAWLIQNVDFFGGLVNGGGLLSFFK